MTEDKNKYVHPGKVLSSELKARGMTQKYFAELISVQQSHLSELIRGKRSITKRLAEKLNLFLNIPVEKWLHLQAEYDYWLKTTTLNDNNTDIEAERLLAQYSDIYDMKVIFKNVGIAAEMSPSEKLKFCKDVLLFDTPIQQKRQLQGFYHRSEKTGLDPRMIATWSVLAKYEARQKTNPTISFDRNKVDGLVVSLRNIFNDNYNTIIKLERTLNEFGIKFCVVPKVNHASIDGFSFFENGIPSIVITKRFNRIDNIAFAVMHEVGHLKLHPLEKTEGRINLQGTDSEYISSEEQEANTFAANSLIPLDLWEKLPSVPLNPQKIQIICAKWAKENRLNKWIVLGRVSYETGMYMFKSDASREIN